MRSNESFSYLPCLCNNSFPIYRPIIEIESSNDVFFKKSSISSRILSAILHGCFGKARVAELLHLSRYIFQTFSNGHREERARKDCQAAAKPPQSRTIRREGLARGRTYFQGDTYLESDSRHERGKKREK